MESNSRKIPKTQNLELERRGKNKITHVCDFNSIPFERRWLGRLCVFLHLAFKIEPLSLYAQCQNAKSVYSSNGIPEALSISQRMRHPTQTVTRLLPGHCFVLFCILPKNTKNRKQHEMKKRHPTETVARFRWWV